MSVGVREKFGIASTAFDVFALPLFTKIGLDQLKQPTYTTHRSNRRAEVDSRAD
jgi:hypothetical protein